MGWFSDIFSPEVLLPIAAGALTGGAGFAALAAGAGTGAGIAALQGEDPLMGAVTGGLGGMSGGSLSSAFGAGSAGAGAATSEAAKVGAQGATTTGAGLSTPSSATQMFQAAGNKITGTTAPSSFASFNPVSPFQQAGSGAQALSNSSAFANFQPSASLAPASNATQSVFANRGIGDAFSAGNYGDALSEVGGGFKQGIQNLGGGNTAKGAGRLGLMGLGPAVQGGLFETQPMDFTQIEDGMYDPNYRLDLSNDTGLRLIANGGYIGKRNYSEGGYLEGGGVPAVMQGSETEVISTERDGMSDSIAATIDESQPAALSEGEFVVPADVVSFAGNGSSEAGARKFYKMLGDIREASTGQREQIKEIDVEEYIPMSDGIGALA